MLEDGVLRHQHEAEGRDEVVDAVVDLRVHVVGTAGDHQDLTAALPGEVDILRALLLDQVPEAVVGFVGLADGLDGLPLGHAELVGQELGALFLKILRAVDAQVGVEVLALGQGGDVHRQQVGVVGDDGAVIMVVCQVLVEVVGHAGVEDGVHALVQ